MTPDGIPRSVLPQDFCQPEDVEDRAGDLIPDTTGRGLRPILEQEEETGSGDSSRKTAP